MHDLQGELTMIAYKQVQELIKDMNEEDQAKFKETEEYQKFLSHVLNEVIRKEVKKNG